MEESKNGYSFGKGAFNCSFTNEKEITVETKSSSWRVLCYLLMSICFSVFSSMSADAAVKSYILSINSSESVVHTSGGFTGKGMGDLSISGAFLAVVTDGVIAFKNIDVATIPAHLTSFQIVPSYPGAATQTSTNLTFSGSMLYHNNTGGGDFNGAISGSTFFMSGNFLAPCCDQYNYELTLSGTVSVPSSPNALTNGSFENGFTPWDVSIFSILSSVTDSSGHVHLPTEGAAMVGITNSSGFVQQSFLSADKAYMLSFDRNVVAPQWSGGDLQAMSTWLYLQDSTGKTLWVDSSQFSQYHPTAPNTWERILLKVPRFLPNGRDLTAGEIYRLKIAVSQAAFACIPEAPSCSNEQGRGTVLIDNVVLTPISEYVCPGIYNPVCGSNGLTYNNECEAAVAGVGEVGPSIEVCDGRDNDCNGQIDEGLGQTTCGLGECAHTIDNCIAGRPQTCDPFEGAKTEICDGLDNNCDGTVDEDCTLAIDTLSNRRRKPGQEINLVGRNFGGGNPGDYVRIGSKKLPHDHNSIIEWTPTNIKIKIPKSTYVSNGCAWFQGLNESKVKVWVNKGGVDSNKKILTLSKNPADCQ